NSERGRKTVASQSCGNPHTIFRKTIDYRLPVRGGIHETGPASTHLRQPSSGENTLKGTSDLALHDVIDALATARIARPVELPKAARQEGAIWRLAPVYGPPVEREPERQHRWSWVRRKDLSRKGPDQHPELGNQEGRPGIASNYHMTRCDTGPGGRNRMQAGPRFYSSDPLPHADPGAKPARCLREPACQSHGIDDPPVTIPAPSANLVRQRPAQEILTIPAIQCFDGTASASRLGTDSIPDRGTVSKRQGPLHPAARRNSFSGADRLENLRGFDRVQAGEKETDIAPGRTETQLGSLEKLDGDASLCEPIRRRDAHDAAPDDDHIRCGGHIIVRNFAVVRLPDAEGTGVDPLFSG